MDQQAELDVLGRNYLPIARRLMMSEHRKPFDSIAEESLNAELDTGPQESICRLQYMIAFLIEKNERIRQELAARRSEEEAYFFRSDQSSGNG
jgi:hypothetical protein